jgi:hypothetical protein
MSKKTTIVQSSDVLPPSSPTPPPSEEDVMKFFIGLRMLGEIKKHRYLSYLASVQNAQSAKEETYDHSI